MASYLQGNTLVAPGRGDAVTVCLARAEWTEILKHWEPIDSAEIVGASAAQVPQMAPEVELSER